MPPYLRQGSNVKIRFQSLFMLITTQFPFLGFVEQRLRECADLAVGQTASRTVGVFPRRIVMQHEGAPARRTLDGR